MVSISNVFQKIDPKCAFIPFITAGYPSLEITKTAVQILDNYGADIIELGIPYSDPLADGPTIQEASSHALKLGIRINDILSMLSNLIPSIKAPIVLFTYYNPVLNYGPENFIKKISEIGVKGILIPDLPLEESSNILDLTKQYNIELIMLIAPTSSIDRVKSIVEISQGCIYLVSSTGVTGARESFSINIQDLIQKIRSFKKIPVIVGFGISTPQQISQVKSWGAQGIVMGSAFIKALSNCKGNDLSSFLELCEKSQKAILEKVK
uniref:tryptophan synthase alpha subunit n=1 Tax=Porphyridium aerugineum TaxID=2792 RepID=UPI001FCDAD28|nr:tryptophan synthase alpha subunit [Porphyridium aerugineum]UNJ17955.1 tryptophan synthase alpha subunit [Porphyridium aerugineum]